MAGQTHHKNTTEPESCRTAFPAEYSLFSEMFVTFPAQGRKFFHSVWAKRLFFCPSHIGRFCPKLL